MFTVFPMNAFFHAYIVDSCRERNLVLKAPENQNFEMHFKILTNLDHSRESHIFGKIKAKIVAVLNSKTGRIWPICLRGEKEIYLVKEEYNLDKTNR